MIRFIPPAFAYALIRPQPDLIDRRPVPIRHWLAPAAILVLSGLIAFGQFRALPIQDYDAWFHFGAFCTITALAVIAWPHARFSHFLVGLAALGGLTELLQFLPALNREPSWRDFAFNLLGIGLTLGMIATVRRFRARP